MAALIFGICSETEANPTRCLNVDSRDAGHGPCVVSTCGKLASVAALVKWWATGHGFRRNSEQCNLEALLD